jgi:hypothetical protein
MKNFILHEDEWKRERLGRISSSNYSKLQGKGTKGSFFTKGAETYLDSLVAERLTGSGIDISSLPALDWGNEHEAGAHKAFVEKFNPDKDDFYGGDIRLFLTEGTFLGGSPDSIVEKDGVTYICEIKCPSNSTNHIKNLQLVTPEDLLANHKDYYAQIQMNMYLYHSISGCDPNTLSGLFISYDPRIRNEKVKHLSVKILEVPFDHDFMADAQIRLAEAVDLLKSKIKTIFNSN